MATLVLSVWLPRILVAQTSYAPLVVYADLPDAPGRDNLGGQFTEQQGDGSISGTVTDISGGLVAGARVTLIESGRPDERLATSGSDGRFTFDHLAAGRFKLTITAIGLETFVASEIVIRAGERHELARIDLPVASASTAVTVVVTQEQLAQEQIEEAEKQVIFGIFANFYSSYVWNAAPLSSKQKYNLAFHAVTNPGGFLVTGVLAGVEQARDTFPGYGQGAQGYAKRYGAAYADDVIGRMLGSAVLPSILHQDPRYFYRGSGTRKERALYALRSTLVCKGDDGTWQPNYSFVGGVFATGAISNVYHDAGDRGVGLTIRNGFIQIGGRAADNLLREFLLRKITPKVPAYEHGRTP